MKINKQYIGIIIGVIICVLLVFVGVYATTTVGNDVTIGGTLTATGIVSFGSTASITDDLEVGGSIFYVNVGSQSYNFGGTGSASFTGPVNIIGDFHVGIINDNNSAIGLYNDVSAYNLIANYDGIAFIGNTIDAPVDRSSILGGDSNQISGNSSRALIGSGVGNRITTEGPYNGIGREIIVGGNYNLIDIVYHADSDGMSFIGGGANNTIKASYGTIPGGDYNVVSGSYGFAAGRRAQALAQGDFALSDSTDADYTLNTANVFGARFSNGYYLTGGAVSVSSSGIRLDEGITITSGTASASGDCGVAGSIYFRSAQVSIDSVISICGSDAAWNPADL